ncbi:hypothetical protein BKA57DRAFT_469527 [Linnemannia elongata]|nr:hypothetical protein BKA57DRAFT_469527 [Linnemannia elongata]
MLHGDSGDTDTQVTETPTSLAEPTKELTEFSIDTGIQEFVIKESEYNAGRAVKDPDKSPLSANPPSDTSKSAATKRRDTCRSNLATSPRTEGAKSRLPHSNQEQPRTKSEEHSPLWGSRIRRHCSQEIRCNGSGHCHFRYQQTGQGIARASYKSHVRRECLGTYHKTRKRRDCLSQRPGP